MAEPFAIVRDDDQAASTLSCETITVLKMEAVRQAMAANYSRLMHEIVFTRVPRIEDNDEILTDRKAIISFRRTLDQRVANDILSLIWKESSYVRVRELDLLSIVKLFVDAPLTSHALGVLIAEKKEDVSAAVTRIRGITLAGAAYGLVERISGTGNRVPLVATPILHNFMVRLGTENRRVFEQAIPRRVNQGGGK